MTSPPAAPLPGRVGAQEDGPAFSGVLPGPGLPQPPSTGSSDQNGPGLFHLNTREDATPTQDDIATHLTEAQTFLAAQHERTLHLIAKRIERSRMIEKELQRVQEENSNLRARLLDADCFPRGAESSDVGVPSNPSIHLVPCGVPAPPPAAAMQTMSVWGDDADVSFGSNREHSSLVQKLKPTPQTLSGNFLFELLPVWHRDDSAQPVPTLLQKKARRAFTVHKQSSPDIEHSQAIRRSSTVCGRLVIHPHHPSRTLWDVGSLVLVVYDMFMIPMGFFDMPQTTFLVFMQWVTRLFWSCDISVSFLSGFLTDNGIIELRPSAIAKRYFKGWFSLDCLVVGVDWLEIIFSAAAEGMGFARLGKASRIFRIIRMIRLLRLARMNEVINLLTERLNSEKIVVLVDIVKLMVFMICSAHMVGCLWYAIAISTERNWVNHYDYNLENIEYRYIMAFRWAISQFGGGMDEVTPKSFEESVYALIVFLVSYWSGAVFLSVLTSSMTQLYIGGSKNAQQLSVLRRFVLQNHVSKKLALRVQRNAQHAMKEHQRSLPENKVELLKLVSEPLRVEVHFEMFSPVLSKHPFFARYIEECPHVMRKVCHSACQISQMSAGDVIFSTGEIPARPMFYIIDDGSLEYVSLTGEQTSLAKDDFISEQNLWVPWTHRGELNVLMETRLCMLDAKEFQNIVSQFEHPDFDPATYAADFVTRLNETTKELTDMGLQVPEETKRSFRKTGFSLKQRENRLSGAKGWIIERLSSDGHKDAFSQDVIRASHTLEALDAPEQVSHDVPSAQCMDNRKPPHVAEDNEVHKLGIGRSRVVEEDL